MRNIVLYENFKSEYTFNESKQVGKLYHYTFLIHALQIVNDNVMKVGQLHESISFTRDQNFHKTSFIFKKEHRDVRIVFDGDKLSEKYKIRPYDYFGDLKGKSSKNDQKVEFQAEEMIKENITDVKKYIISIDLPDPNHYDTILNTYGFEVNNFMKKMRLDPPYEEKYVELEERLGMTMDAKEYFESKGFKVNFFK